MRPQAYEGVWSAILISIVQLSHLRESNSAIKKVCKAIVKEDVKSKVVAKKWL